ncbi:MAG: YceI family protein [Candidatus Latescibacteria bacterium]|jgi:polyisoprenoid-binding protein YceI|nr:YceI family protein [Candidatus Latescibacterota bacterium]
MNIRWIVGLLLAASLEGQQVGAETALGLGVDGVQTIQLSDKVGKNQVQFVSSAPMEDIHGTASEISGELKLDPANVEGMTGKIEVQVASMETGIKKRDEHLHGKDWLDVEQFPVIAFEFTGLEDASVKADKDKATIKGLAVGTFSLHGVTKDLEIPFEATYLLASEKTKKRAPGDLFVVKGAFQIVLKDFDIKGARGMVGRKVGTEIELKANFFGSTVVEEGE